MSAAGPQLKQGRPAESQRRTSIETLLHALNQPLTGLQCSLELAAAGPRRTEQYIETLREGLELTSRMRDLVNAIREIVDLKTRGMGEIHAFDLEEIVREIAQDLVPVAEQKAVRIRVQVAGPLIVQADRQHLQSLVFRLLESALTLAQAGSDLQVVAGPESDQAQVAISWSEPSMPGHSPFCRAGLGLLVAGAGWENVGADWVCSRTAERQSCTIRLALARDFSTGN